MKLTRRKLAAALVSATAVAAQQPQPAARSRRRSEGCAATASRPTPTRSPRHAAAHGHRAGLPVQGLRRIMAAIGTDTFFATIAELNARLEGQGILRRGPGARLRRSPGTASARATTRWRCRCRRKPSARPRTWIRTSSASACAARCRAFPTASRICSATPASPPPGARSPTPARCSITTPR